MQFCSASRIGVRCALALLSCSLVSSDFFAAGPIGSQSRRAEKAIRDGDYERAEKLYRDHLARNRADLAARLGLSFALMKRGRASEAYLEASIVAGQEPLNARAHALMGLALLRSGVFADSVEELNTAQVLDEREAMALAGLAEVDFFENRARMAYERLQRAVRIDSSEPEYWIAFGRTAARLERFAEAAADYERFLVVSPRLESEKRVRYRGLIDFYHALAGLGISHLHHIDGPKSVRVPIELKNERPVVRVKINGSRTVSLVIDTGASISVLSTDLASALGMRPLAKGGNARAVGGGGTFPIVYGLADSLELGELKVSSVPVYMRSILQTEDEPGALRSERLEGFIGLSVLSNFRVTVDYRSRALWLRRGEVGREETMDAGEITSIPFRSTNGGLMSAEVDLPDRQKVNFLVDTGASTTVLAEQVMEKYGLKRHIVAGDRVRVLGAAGIKDDVEVVLVPSISVSGLERRNVRAPILDLEPVNESAGFLQSGILGGNFLKHFLVTFDFDQYRIQFRPAQAATGPVPGPGA